MKSSFADWIYRSENLKHNNLENISQSSEHKMSTSVIVMTYLVMFYQWPRLGKFFVTNFEKILLSN